MQCCISILKLISNGIMKIQAGRYKGTVLRTKSPLLIRPTTDSIKSWIFQIIDPYLSGASFLDLFAGSGNIGIEAISRGCQFTAFVDNATQPLIRKNLKILNNIIPVQIYSEDVLHFLRRRHPAKMMFHIIFADPPYQYPYFFELIRIIATAQIFAEEGLFILESGKHSFTLEPDETPSAPPLSLLRKKYFGETRISIFQKES